MTDTTATVPAWLATAEADRERAAGSDALFRQQQAEKRATAINQALARLDMEPITRAYAYGGVLHPAVLLEPDPERGHYGVHAGWSDKSDHTELLVEDFEGEFTGRRFSRLLHRPADVLDARENPPARKPEPRRDFRAEALRSMDALRVDYVGADAAAVAEAVNGLTAAVLHLADVTVNRP